MRLASPANCARRGRPFWRNVSFAQAGSRTDNVWLVHVVGVQTSHGQPDHSWRRFGQQPELHLCKLLVQATVIEPA